MKRIIDLLISLSGLLILSPFILLIAIVVKFKLGSPIIFKQQRPGLNGKPFYLYKFRSMSNERDDEGNLLPEYQRLTPTGIFLRKFSLDELPQLINVIKGDISLVGPRPLLMEYLPLYSEEQAKRHLVKPGITGWAQVNGRNVISWEERFKFDVWYVENQTLSLDIKIFWLTFKKVVRSEGVIQDEQEFRGTENKMKVENGKRYLG